MTDHEQIAVIDYSRERFDKLESLIGNLRRDVQNLHNRVDELEAERDSRAGRNNFIIRTAQSFGASIAALAAIVAVYLGLKDA